MSGQQRAVSAEHIRALTVVLNRSPYFSLLGMEIRTLGQGTAQVTLQPDPAKHMNPFGSVHGGALASLLDTAAYWAAYCGLDEEAGYTTIDLVMNDLAMAGTDRITAVGRVIKQGRSLLVCEAEARDASGRLLATAVSKMMVLQGKQSIRDLMCQQGTVLPPKFLQGAESS